jgi:methylated-DNA-[protein]-cysteine S-methyltransferase
VNLVSDTFRTPLGTLTLEASEHGLTAIQFPRATKSPTQGNESNPILGRAKIELEAYFRGDLTQFTVPLHWQGTPFQQAVWEALTRIPFGQTVSYRDIAKLIDRPRAARPVGGAVGRNPLPIIVPCHRVIGSDQSLTGFTGGLWIKEQLLQLEGALPTT